jgi:microcystin degradation protein MlrC
MPGSPSRVRPPRVAVGGILHETHTFAPGVTTIAAFAERVLLRGSGLLSVGGQSESALGGAIAMAEGRAELVPTLFASAMPGPPVAEATFSQLADDLLRRLRQEARRYPGVEGVVLLLHGAMVTESDDDPEGTLLERVREIVGPARPVVAVLDSHATVTPRMADAADVLLAYRTYPHLDARARGMEALERCVALAAGGARPILAHRKLPLLMPLLAQATDAGGPLGPVLAAAQAWRTREGIASVSLVPGFPYADVPGAGSSILVYADIDPALAGEAAADLRDRWWSARETFRHTGQPIDRLLDGFPDGPVVVADIADNPGAGAPADGTLLLRFFLDHGLEKAAFACLADPEAVAACHDAGAGATIDLAIGAKSGPLAGEPVHPRWRVEHLGDGVFANRGPMARGGLNRIGRTATVSAHGVSVMLSERRVQALDPAVFTAGGIDPDGCRWLVVKSSVHYRAAFRALATSMIDIETAGFSGSTLESLPYNRVPRPIWPLDDPDRAADPGSRQDVTRV